MAMDYGLCKGKRKDGKPCTMPVNKAEGGYCEFHVVAAFNRAQRQGQDTTRSKPKNGSGGHSLQSMLMGNAAPGVLALRTSGSLEVSCLILAHTHHRLMLFLVLSWKAVVPCLRLCYDDLSSRRSAQCLTAEMMFSGASLSCATTHVVDRINTGQNGLTCCGCSPIRTQPRSYDGLDRCSMHPNR